MKRPTNAQLVAYVRAFDGLGTASKADAILSLIDYARGEGAPYGILRHLRTPHSEGS